MKTQLVLTYFFKHLTSKPEHGSIFQRFNKINQSFTHYAFSVQKLPEVFLSDTTVQNFSPVSNDFSPLAVFFSGIYVCRWLDSYLAPFRELNSIRNQFWFAVIVLFISAKLGEIYSLFGDLAKKYLVSQTPVLQVTSIFSNRTKETSLFPRTIFTCILQYSLRCYADNSSKFSLPGFDDAVTVKYARIIRSLGLQVTKNLHRRISNTSFHHRKL